MQYRVLGEVQAAETGRELELEIGGPRQRALLARLLIGRNELVTRDQLAEDLYPGSPKATKALQVAVVRLRAALAQAEGGDGATALESREGGYLLRVDDGALDATAFESGLAAAEGALASGQPELATELLDDALALWRGAAFAGCAHGTWAQAEARRLEELRVTALERRAEADLRRGEPAHAIAALQALVQSHPARERLWSLLMLALYRHGRQAEALVAYRQARAHLLDEYGIEPSAALRELHQAILRQDGDLTIAHGMAAPGGRSSTAAGAWDSEVRPLVGRRTERAALASALERCAGGERIIALLSGEPGIGKTRLAGEVAKQAGARGFRVRTGRCERDLALPFKPFVEALGELPGPSGGRGGDIEGMQYALFASVAAQLRAAGRREPLLLVLEDLHWADPASLLLLRHLITTPEQPRLMILGTYRSSDLAPRHPLRELIAGLHREQGVLRLELIGLLEADIGQLARITLGRDRRLSTGALRALREATAGNPLFLTELLHSLGDTDLDLAAWESGGQELPVSASIREAVLDRVQRLGEQVAASLRAASILGSSFEAADVAAILGRDRSTVEDDFERALEDRLIEREGDRRAFRHGVIAQTLYESLPVARRQELHLRAAQLLEQRSPPEPAEVAKHWLGAGTSADGKQPSLWARRAGDDALAKFAPQEAVRWFSEALRLSRFHGSEAEQSELLIALGVAQRFSGERGFRETLLEAARLAHRTGQRHQLVRAALANTRGFVSATGGVDQERIAVLEQALEVVEPDQVCERALLLATLAAEISFTGDWQRRVNLSDTALALAREAGDPQTLVQVLSQRNVTVWSPATLARRLRETKECQRTADILDDPLAQFQAVHWRASACVEHGDFGEATECRRRGRRLAERLRQPTVLWMSTYDRANEAIIAGDLDEAERYANEAFALGSASGQPDALLILASQLMVIRYEQGRLGETTQLVATSLQENPRITGFRSVLALGYCEEKRPEKAAELLIGDAEGGFEALARDLTWLSVVCVYGHVAARIARASLVHRDLLRNVRELLEPWRDQVAYTGAGGWGLVEHYLGMLELALGDPERARRSLQAAVHRAERLSAPIWAAHSRLELARTLLELRHHRDAELLLREASATAEQLGAGSIARDCGELLAEAVLGSTAAPPD